LGRVVVGGNVDQEVVLDVDPQVEETA